jgi:hypothetical protein
MVTAAPTTAESARIRAIASGRSAGLTVRASKLAFMPAALKPAL